MIYRRYRTYENKMQDMDILRFSDLADSFFAKDLDMVEKAVSNGGYGKNKMEQAVLDYITGLFAEANPGLCWLDLNNRIDVHGTEGKDQRKELEDFFCRNLEIAKAPMGKWPSKFMPCFMQQLAVNLSWRPSQDNLPIFSVNGPPGTGKTTLLKEIIAGNIVERAVKLHEYEDPDDAFVKKNFQDGDKKNRGYSQYCWRYYDFVDERLKDYGMLVASCNNAAVENITKELPDGEALLKGLTPAKTEKEDVCQGLLEVQQLFQIDGGEKETYTVWNQQQERYESREYPDIYFTKLANDLAKRKDGKWDRWGLISAPFGKTGNLKEYIYSVLKPYIRSFGSNDFIQQRKEEYIRVAQRFDKQYKKVCVMEQELQKISSVRNSFIKKKDSIEYEAEKIQELLEEQKRKAGQIEEELREVSHQLDLERQALREYQSELEALEKRKEQQDIIQAEAESEIQNIRHQIIGLEERRRIWDIILDIFQRPTMLSRTIQEQYQALEKAEKILQDEKDRTEIFQQDLKQRQTEYDRQSKEIDTLTEKQKQILERQSICLGREKSLILEIKGCLKEIEEERNLCREILENASDRQGIQAMTVMDEEFFRCYASRDEKESTAAQTSNPWHTAAYNREREKLFYEALKFHKAFLLASKACLWNFKNLLMLWREPRDDDRKVTKFSCRDMENSFSALINTVFLLTPVLSTTFASAGAMLSHIRYPGEIGCLIIDEAGQASPQMALGSLFRCRRAIVVGDPRQVEPVVTDELDIIKQIIQNDDTSYYQSKTLSVQSFADRLNIVGTTYIENGEKTWVGCPLVVHRRCISPMFDLSNALSYNNLMKQQTALPTPEKEAQFCRESSGWINVSGNENSAAGKNHYVQAQGEKAWELIRKAFQMTEKTPSLFVITPFTTVRDGMRKLLRSRAEYKTDKRFADWVETCIGTVHTFQGKEADQVIFLLGCDKNALSAVRWVNTNIVNVAATRAKYRLYVIGDYTVWRHSALFQKVKGILDSFALSTLEDASDKPGGVSFS